MKNRQILVSILILNWIRSIMMNKKIEFEKLLSTLKTEEESVDAFNARNIKFWDIFIHLPPEFDEVIFDWTQNFLKQIQEDDEEEFTFLVILEGLEERNKALAFSLASEALLHEKTEDKNFYVSFLIRLDFPETPDLLIKALEQFQSFDYLGGHAQETAIEYLTTHKIEKAFPAILNCLSDEADRVRWAALRYILYLDKKEAVPKLKEMLEAEEEDMKAEIRKILNKL